MIESILVKHQGMYSLEEDTGKVLQKKSKDSPFHVHGVEEHGGNVQVRDFKMKVTGIHGGDATKSDYLTSPGSRAIEKAG